MPNASGPPLPPPAPGSLVSERYFVLRQIGEGGMGMVFEAQDVRSGEHVAIKWLHPEHAGRAGASERMLREAHALARVRHPNVVAVHEVLQQTDGTVCLVMELLAGEPLSALIERRAVEDHRLIALLIEVMHGVALAHREGIVHRDIKPDNIFLAKTVENSQPIPKLLDFGISKFTETVGPALTSTGAALGTPTYMSYEQLCGVRDIDARTDVYALGVILYEALAGRPPFEGEALPELIVQISKGRPVPLGKLRPDLPVALVRVVAHAMARQREQRIATIEDLIERLAPFAAPEAFGGAGALVRRLPPRARVIALVCALGIAGLAAFSAWSELRPRESATARARTTSAPAQPTRAARNARQSGGPTPGESLALPVATEVPQQPAGSAAHAAPERARVRAAQSPATKRESTPPKPKLRAGRPRSQDF